MHFMFIRSKRHIDRGAGVLEGKEAYSVHAINITSPWQCFVAYCLSSFISNVVGLHGI
jgi:hypothetical protein